MATGSNKTRKPTKSKSTVGRYVDAETRGRYTRPVGRHVNESPPWYGPAIVAIFVIGLLTITLNYLAVLPGSVSQWYLVAGIIVIFAGFIAMMRFR